MHPNIDATATCNVCGQPICSTCTLEVNGTPVCRPCAEKKAKEQAGQATGTYSQAQPVTVVNKKSSILAAILSFFIPGLGQLYNGQVIKGIVIFITFAVLIWACIGIVPWLYGIYDAYMTAEKINRGEIVKDWFK